jgi:hypothetical protein
MVCLISIRVMEKAQNLYELKLYSEGAWFISLLENRLFTLRFLVAFPILCSQITASSPLATYFYYRQDIV